MLHVLVGVGQVLYAYNLELKEGNVPNEFGTANLTCFFFFFLFSPGVFPAACHFNLCYRRTADRTGFQNPHCPRTVKLHWQGRRFLLS